MDPRITILTLGVSDLKKSTQFYTETLGWPKTSDSNDNITFLQLNNGMLLSLSPTEKLAEDAKLTATASATSSSFRGFTMAYNTQTQDEVDSIFAFLEKEGDVTIVKKPEKVFWGGYSGYMADPDGNLWEIAYNPFLKLNSSDGTVATSSGKESE